MTNVLITILAVVSNVTAAGSAPQVQVRDFRQTGFYLRPVYERTLVEKCGYCKAREDLKPDANGAVHAVLIQGTCTCTYRKRLDHYELVPVLEDGA